MTDEKIELDADVTAEVIATRARMKKAIAITNLLLREGVRADAIAHIDADTWNILARQAEVRPPSPTTQVIITELVRWRLG